MTRPILTCDRQNGLIRCAVWQGKTLLDLYVDRADAPDMTGAVVTGKIVRVSNGGKVAWIDAGLAEKIFLETKAPVKAGERLTVRIASTIDQGKAWIGALANDAEDCPPPLPWQRALADHQAAKIVFAEREDFALFEKSGEEGKAELITREPAHPELDEIIDALLDPVVSLSGGASLVIEPTQALIAIDVNSGAAGQAASINLQAVREAARQIRLRNLSGIIVIDCLKMKDRADISKVLNAFARVAESDPCKVHLFGMSKLGLLEATRLRRGPPLSFLMKD